MKRIRNGLYAGAFVAIAALGMGCEEVAEAIICDNFCDTYIDCIDDANATQDCSWDSPTCSPTCATPGEIADDCQLACDRTLDDFTDKERQALRDCTNCMNRELRGASCDFDTYDYALAACNAECTDEDAVQFFDAWANAFDAYAYNAYDSSGALCVFQ